MGVPTGSRQLARPLHESPPRMNVLYVEYGMGFGGAVISLSITVRGLREVHPDLESWVMTFYDFPALDDLFPHSTLLRPRRYLSYKSRAAFQKAVTRRWIPSVVAKALGKGYSLADAMHEAYLSLMIHRTIQKHGIDLVHVNNGWEKAAMRAARWSGIPCVVHFRKFPEPEDIHPREIEGVKCCIAISTAVRDALVAAGIPPEKVRVVFNPVSLDSYARAVEDADSVREEFDIPSDAVVAAIFGRITEWKGQAEFLRAVGRIAPRAERLVVMIVGDESDAPDPEYRTRVEEIAEGLPLSTPVIFTGFREDVERFYAAADIVVHSSVEPEPFGRVVIEGMASRSAVIAIDEGGPPDIIEDGHDGLLVPPRDVDALARAIEKLYSDPRLRARLADAGLDSVRKRFTPEAIARQVSACYGPEPSG